MNNDLSLIIFLGIVGGILPNVLRVIRAGQNGGNIPKYLKAPMFWVSFILLAVIGGFAAWLLGATDSKQAVAYGFTAPELLSGLVKKETESDRGDEPDKKLGLLEWWSM